MIRRMPVAAGLIVLHCMLCSVVIAGAGDPPTKPSEAAGDTAERARLVGVWKGFTVDGKGENPDRGPVKLELTITEKTIHGIEIKGDERVDHGEGEYTLDPAADPRQLDGAKAVGRNRKQVYIGIYKLEGDTLKWCVSPQKVRPTTFETRKGQFLLILKRDTSRAAATRPPGACSPSDTAADE